MNKPINYSPFFYGVKYIRKYCVNEKITFNYFNFDFDLLKC